MLIIVNLKIITKIKHLLLIQKYIMWLQKSNLFIFYIGFSLIKMKIYYINISILGNFAKPDCITQTRRRRLSGSCPPNGRLRFICTNLNRGSLIRLTLLLFPSFVLDDRRIGDRFILNTPFRNSRFQRSRLVDKVSTSFETVFIESILM